MYSAIAGLKAHMTKLNVIGNNVANVNTNSYKSQRAVFRDTMYTMYSGGSNGTAVMASKNPSQIGYGSQLASIDLNMVGGNLNPGAPMDCALTGDGFFLVGDKDVAGSIGPANAESFKSLSLTRVGQFRISPDGYLTDINGKCVYGFANVGEQADGSPIVSDQLVPIRMPRMEQVPVDKDGKEFENEPNKEDIKGWKTVVRYPVAAMKDEKPATSEALMNKDGLTHVPLQDYQPPKVDDKEQPPLPFAELDSIGIDPKSGRISGTLKGGNKMVTIGFLAIGNVTNPNGVTHTGEFYYSCADGAGEMSISMLGGAEKDLTTVGGGKLSYVNGSLAQKDGDADDAPALSEKGRIMTAGATELYGGGYEGSNTDLATEISEMITTQRGYQANTRIITVTDSMLEELVNMKR